MRSTAHSNRFASLSVKLTLALRDQVDTDTCPAVLPHILEFVCRCCDELECSGCFAGPINAITFPPLQLTGCREAGINVYDEDLGIQTILLFS